MKINILTLYPEMFPGCLGYSLAGKALAEHKYELNVVNMRDFATNAYKSVDDTPFGGGAGMVLRADIVDAALKHLGVSDDIYYLSPRGATYTQKTAEQFAHKQELTFICGRFEGIDERILEKWNITEISIGDFVLSGGEPALLTLLDAMIRLIPSVMGNADSLKEESFSNNLLEYPQYTKPAVWEGMAVPDILLSGHHANIQKWRLTQSEELTKTRRPDLYQLYLANKKGTKND